MIWYNFVHWISYSFLVAIVLFHIQYDGYMGIEKCPCCKLHKIIWLNQVKPGSKNMGKESYVTSYFSFQQKRHKVLDTA